LISTRNLLSLPDVDQLKELLQSMALLDAILQPEWEFRCYSFNSFWAADKQLGSMRNGQGDDFFALFNMAGCWLKGFAHEAPMTPYRAEPKRVWPGVLEGVPAEFAYCLRQPAFNVEDTTFCVWRRYTDAGWQYGPVEYPAGHPDPDGSECLVSPLDGRPETYREWAESYFSGSRSGLAVEPVRHIYEHRPLTEELVRQLNPKLSLEELQADIEEIGYPAGGRGGAETGVAADRPRE
jgi:hypothetical protein